MKLWIKNAAVGPVGLSNEKRSEFEAENFLKVAN